MPSTTIGTMMILKLLHFFAIHLQLKIFSHNTKKNRMYLADTLVDVATSNFGLGLTSTSTNAAFCGQGCAGRPGGGGVGPLQENQHPSKHGTAGGGGG